MWRQPRTQGCEPEIESNRPPPRSARPQPRRAFSCRVPPGSHPRPDSSIVKPTEHNPLIEKAELAAIRETSLNLSTPRNHGLSDPLRDVPPISGPKSCGLVYGLARDPSSVSDHTGARSGKHFWSLEGVARTSPRLKVMSCQYRNRACSAFVGDSLLRIQDPPSRKDRVRWHIRCSSRIQRTRGRVNGVS